MEISRPVGPFEGQIIVQQVRGFKIEFILRISFSETIFFH
jgi:hypothetical protein